MAKLYPPLIGGTIPAFYTDNGATNIVVPFSMNRAVGKSEVSKFILKIKYVDGDVIDTIISGDFDTETYLKASFDVSALVTQGLLKVGQYYKIQLAYIDKSNTIGYYSTIGVIKYTTLPNLVIEGISQASINTHQYYYVGVYQQNKEFGGDSTEKVYSSRFLLTDNEGNIIKDTDYVLHNTSEDDKSYESREMFFYGQDLKENVTYYLTYSVKTMNGLEYSSPRYRIIQSHFLGLETEGLQLLTNLNYENGYVKLGLKSDKIIISGTFLISRACSKDDYAWTEIKRFNAESLDISEWEFLDCTIEQGYNYKYSIQQYNSNNIYSKRIVSSELYVDFEHAFLYDGVKQLKISYDPKITNFKNNILENKVDTIGNKYPFILRNGNVKYKSFDIQGLISLRTDEENLFSNLKFSDENFNIPSNLTSENIAVERKFKMEVLEWLNDGKPKLFRSPTEGNFIVRLLNVSLTPNDKLGRMIHSFKATAYEITEYSNENLQTLNIIDSKEKISTLMRWSTIDLKELYKKLKAKDQELVKSNSFYPIINGIKIYSIKAQNFSPGTIIKIDDSEIMIGATGAYIVEDIDGFNSIQVKLPDFSGEGFDLPLITYSYKSNSVSLFSSITGIQEQEIPLRQFFGEVRNNKNILDQLNNKWESVTHLELIRFKKKDAYQIFVDFNSVKDFQEFIKTSQSSYDFISDCYKDRDKKEKITNFNSLSKTAIYYIRLTRRDNRYHNENPNEPYNNEGYYIDKNEENFAPYTGYFLDGKTHKIGYVDDDLFTVQLNKEKISLNEKNEYKVVDPSIIKSIILKAGVIAEISYLIQRSTYNFGIMTGQVALEAAVLRYESIPKEIQNTLISYSYKNPFEAGKMTDSQINTFIIDTNKALEEYSKEYQTVLNSLDAVIQEYNERKGIE